MSTKTIEIYPVPKEYWWDEGEEGKISILPVQDWKIEGEEYISWPWWKLKDSDNCIFINSQLKMIGVKEKDKEKGSVLNLLLLEFLRPSIEGGLVFSPKIFPYWEYEYLGPQVICNSIQRTLEPMTTVYDERFDNLEEYKEAYEKIKPFLGTYSLKFKDYVTKFDLGTNRIRKYEEAEVIYFYEYISVYIGFEEKTDCHCSGEKLHEKRSLIKSIMYKELKEKFK